jgi:hypothetical protein
MENLAILASIRCAVDEGGEAEVDFADGSAAHCGAI